MPAGELMAEARALAEVIATKSPIGLRLAKESLNRVEDLGLKDGYRLEQDYTGRITRYHDSAEARRRTSRSAIPNGPGPEARARVDRDGDERCRGRRRASRTTSSSENGNSFTRQYDQ